MIYYLRTIYNLKNMISIAHHLHIDLIRSQINIADRRDNSYQDRKYKYEEIDHM